MCCCLFFFFFQAEDGIRDDLVTGVQTCALPIYPLLAEAELEGLARSLERAHPGAAASLREGLAETLTITRLGVPPTLARSLRSTDESFKARVCCRPAGTGLASWSGVVDPGAKSRV